MTDHGEDNGSEDRTEPPRNKERPREPISRWEWVVTILSAILVVATIGALLWRELTYPDTPPRVEIVVETVVDLGDRYLVEFRAHNRGNSTAKGLSVEGTLEGDSETVETASTSIDYVPPLASRRGGLYFQRDPREFRLDVQPKGFDYP